MTFSVLDRRRFLGGFSAATAVMAGAASGSFASSARSRRLPNIVLITADDLGYGDLSGYGRADYQTPMLDRLASQGMRFTQAYSIAPICTPTRVGLMTGRYPGRFQVGLYEPLTAAPHTRHVGLEADVPTLSSLLKRAGYSTGLFGKWHLGVQPHHHPLKHGFDEFFGPLGGAVDYVSHTDPIGRHDLHRNHDPAHVSGYLTDVIADEAVRYIRRAREPFFLSHQGTAPHSPWQQRGDAPLAPPGPASRGMVAGPSDRFPGMMRALDEAVGRILAALETRGVATRTLVIFTSDNGGNELSSMGGLSGQKDSLREGGIRVPAFARWPGVIPAGVTSRQVLTTLDWTATMLSAGRAWSGTAYGLDGIDLLPILSGADPTERTIFWRTVQGQRQAAVRAGSWKYLRDADGEYLFNLALDPGERHDLSGKQPTRVKTMRTAHARWEKEMLPAPT